MSRHQPPDVLLIKLLQRSDVPSDEDLIKLKSAILSQISDDEASSRNIISIPAAHWLNRNELRKTAQKAFHFVKYVFSVCISLIWRLLVKTFSFSSRPSLQ
jgi:hypothetical protein